MTAHTAQSLVYVVRQTLPKVRSLSRQLDDVPAREKDAILRRLESAATTLSQALSRLSYHVEHLSPEPSEGEGGGAPERMTGPQFIGLQMFLNAASRPACDTCGGILPDPDPPKVEPDPRQLYLALREHSRVEREEREAGSDGWNKARAVADRHDDV